MIDPDDWHEPCTATILDTHTGSTAISDRWSPWQYWQGNACCDCNRKYLFGIEDDNSFRCDGCHRFLVIACDRPCGITLQEMNADYPLELTQKFLPAEVSP